MSKHKKARHGGLVMVREPTGRLSRATLTEVEDISPTQAKRLRDAALRGMADPNWGSELGRLYLAQKIASELYEAGRRWTRLVVAYYKAIGATPPYPKAQHFEHFEPAHPVELVGDELKRELRRQRAIISDMLEAHAVLWSAGILCERAVRSLCEEDQAPVGEIGFKAMTRGLEWLASYWGLTDQRLTR